MSLNLKPNWRNIGGLLDSMLPEEGRGLHKTSNYLAVAAFLFVIAMIAFNLVVFLSIHLDLTVVVGSMAILATGIFGIFALKKGLKVERITGLFLIVLTSALGIMLTYGGRSAFVPGAFFFLIIIMYVSFFASKRWATLQACYVVLVTLFFFLKTSEYGLIVPFHWPFETFANRLEVVVVLLCFTAYVCMILHDSFKRRGEAALSQEKAWLVRSSRLHEISVLADSLSFQISGPLKEFANDLKTLREATGEAAFGARERSLVQDMSRSVDALIQVSRSFDWIYRSQKLDNRGGADLDVLLNHVRVLLEGKAFENGWGLTVHTDDPQAMMQGRIPALVLLMVTLAHQKIDRYIATSDMTLRIEAKAGKTDREPFEWRMSWPRTGDRTLRFRDAGAQQDLIVMVDELREALIEELRRDCSARIEWRSTDLRFEILLLVPGHVASLD